MAGPLGKAMSYQRLRPFEIDQSHQPMITDDCIPIAPLQGRAGDHARVSAPEPDIDLRSDGGKPRLAIPIFKSLTGVHLGDVCWRMKAVAVDKRPTKPPR